MIRLVGNSWRHPGVTAGVRRNTKYRRNHYRGVRDGCLLLGIVGSVLF
jgi:hypothetical protein